MTKRYWDNLGEESRYRALKMILSLPDDSIREYARRTSSQLGFAWRLVEINVKISGDDEYKTYVNHTHLH